MIFCTPPAATNSPPFGEAMLRSAIVKLASDASLIDVADGELIFTLSVLEMTLGMSQEYELAEAVYNEVISPAVSTRL